MCFLLWLFAIISTLTESTKGNIYLKLLPCKICSGPADIFQKSCAWYDAPTLQFISKFGRVQGLMAVDYVLIFFSINSFAGSWSQA